MPTLRSVVLRYGDVAALSGALSETSGSLPLPDGESARDGEWVLAIFEIGSRRRATAAAARCVRAAGDTHLEFERRDWDRIVGFVSARSEHMKVARPITASPPAKPVELKNERPTDAPEDTGRFRRFTDLSSAPIESSRVPFGARVLVVDKDRSGDELRATLAEMGLVVELVSSVQRAEERAAVGAFDAIVLDLHVAGADARPFIGRIRNDERFINTPILLLSSRSTSRDVVDAFASGGDDFLSKPFRTPELAARIFSLLRRARIASDVAGSPDR